jgi:hypothetical protein
LFETDTPISLATTPPDQLHPIRPEPEPVAEFHGIG